MHKYEVHFFTQHFYTPHIQVIIILNESLLITDEQKNNAHNL